MQQHAWPGVAHDRLRLLAILLLVAMHRTVGAGRFFLTERALLETYLGVVEKLRAVVTQVSGIVVGRAVDTHHLAHRPEFTFEVFFHLFERRAVFRVNDPELGIAVGIPNAGPLPGDSYRLACIDDLC